MIEPIRDRISLAPFRAELARYSRHLFRLDLQAGLTVASFAVPQAMAYALLAGVPPANGLYAAIVMSVVAALWGSSPYLNSGPTNSSALLTAGALLLVAGWADQETAVVHLALLVGLFRIALGVLRLGWVVRFVPESAWVGFTAGAGLLIALGQLHHLLGVAGSQDPWFPMRLQETLRHLPQCNPYALTFGLGTLVVMLIFGGRSKKYPVALASIAASAVAAALLGPGAGVRLVRDLAPVPRGFPGFTICRLQPELTGALLMPAAALALIGLLEAVSIGEILALKHRQRLNFNQEFFGQGLSQFVAAFFHGFPGSGSFSRSALVEQAGGRTRMANVFFGVTLAAAVAVLPAWLERIPVSALAGLLLYVGWRLIDRGRVLRVWRTSAADSAVLLVTFLVTVLIKIEYGVFAGIVVSMALFLNRASALRVHELLPHAQYRYIERGYTPGSLHARSDLVAVAVHGDLFFGLARQLREQLNEIAAAQEPRAIVLRVRRAYTIDYSCWNALFEFAAAFHERGGRLYLCGVRSDFRRIIQAAGMQAILPATQVFAYTAMPFKAFESALAAAFRDLPPAAVLSPEWSACQERVRCV